MKTSKYIFAIVALALALLLVSSPFIGFSSSTASTVDASGVPASVSQAGDYGDIMQYDWPVGGADEGLTGFNPGPAPGRPDILWQVTAMGSGHVSVFNGKAFVLPFFGSTLRAFDAFNGSLLYAVAAPGTPSPSSVSGVHKLDDTYFLTEGTTGMVCRRIETGEVEWDVSIPGGMGHPGSGTYFAGHYSESMKIYFAHAWNATKYEAQILAYNLSDPSRPATLAWTYLADMPSEILCSGDGKLFLGSTEATVYALDGKTGNRVWQTPTMGGLAQQSGIYYNGKLYTSATSTQMTCFDGETGKILWQYEKGPRTFSAYRGAAGHGIIFDATVEIDPHGHIRAWDAETGELIWKQPAYYNIAYTTMAVADGKVYTSTCDQPAGSQTAGLVMPGYETTCFDAYTGTVLWKLRDINFATPSIAYGNLYGISGNSLYCIGGDPADWTHGFVGNVENPRVAVDQSGPSVLKLKWAYQTDGDVSSSPAVVDGKVYIGSHDKNWYCLDAYTGKKIWNFTIGHYVRSSAAVVGGRVFTGADDGYFYALDANTGDQIWKTPAGGHFPNMLVSTEFQPRSSPIVIGNRIYVGSLDGNVYCLNTDGEIQWTYPTGGPIFGSPAYNNGIIYITSTDTYLYALDATNGDFKWRSFPLNLNIGIPDRGILFNIGTPTVADGIVFVGGGVQYGTAVPGVDYYPHSVPGGAWGGTIRFFAFDATTGGSIWNQTRAGNTQPGYVPAYFNGIIYAPEFFVITAMDDMNPNSGPYEVPDFGEFIGARRPGNRRWGQWLGYQIVSSVAYVDDIRGPKVYVGCDIGSVYCLDASTGESLSVYTTGGNVPSSPAIWKGKLYVGSVDGKIYCFDDSPAVSTSIWAESSKGAKCWPNETVVISGQLVSNPDEIVWEMETDTYVPVASTLHPGIPNATILVTFTKPDQTLVNVTATTDGRGYFSVSYTPDVAGNYTWMAWYEGADLDSHSYTYAYGDHVSLKVVSPEEPTNGEEPPPTDEEDEEGIPTEYIYAIVAVIAIVIIAIAGYAYMKRRKK